MNKLQHPAPVPEEQPPSALQKTLVGAVMVVAGLYLLNPTAGILELIPDVIPVVGNLDEATAVALIISGLNFYGVNTRWLTALFGAPRKRKRKRQE